MYTKLENWIYIIINEYNSYRLFIHNKNNLIIYNQSTFLVRIITTSGTNINTDSFKQSKFTRNTKHDINLFSKLTNNSKWVF